MIDPVQYLEDRETGLLTLVLHNDLDLKWVRSSTVLIVHEFERDSPDHTLFLLKHGHRINNDDIEQWT
jgi:hypothetical protein